MGSKRSSAALLRLLRYECTLNVRSHSRVLLSSADKMYNVLQDPYSSQLPSRYVHVTDDQMTHRMIVKGKYAIIGSILDSIFFSEDYIINEDLKVSEEGVARPDKASLESSGVSCLFCQKTKLFVSAKLCLSLERRYLSFIFTADHIYTGLNRRLLSFCFSSLVKIVLQSFEVGQP